MTLDFSDLAQYLWFDELWLSKIAIMWFPLMFCLFCPRHRSNLSAFLCAQCLWLSIPAGGVDMVRMEATAILRCVYARLLSGLIFREILVCLSSCSARFTRCSRDEFPSAESMFCFFSVHFYQYRRLYARVYSCSSLIHDVFL